MGCARQLERAGCWAVCRHDDAYPEALRDAADAPRALLGRGDPAGLARLRPETTVTVVGARRATSYGREIARRLASQLAGAGFAVVSGLAWGIDGAAHEGALEAGLTVAVLGCGADVAYPRHHAKLYERIREQGLLLSELPPGTGAWRWTFPARNRIMAALGAMTVVVEAAGRSGSLITSDLAGDLGREVGAVPGPVGARMSAGTNDLIADGARLIRGADDVLDALIGPGRSKRPICGPPLELEPWRRSWPGSRAATRIPTRSPSRWAVAPTGRRPRWRGWSCSATSGAPSPAATRARRCRDPATHLA